MLCVYASVGVLADLCLVADASYSPRQQPQECSHAVLVVKGTTDGGSIRSSSLDRILLLVCMLSQSQENHGQLLLVDFAVFVVITSREDRVLELLQVFCVVILSRETERGSSCYRRGSHVSERGGEEGSERGGVSGGATAGEQEERREDGRKGGRKAREGEEEMDASGTDIDLPSQTPKQILDGTLSPLLSHSTPSPLASIAADEAARGCAYAFTRTFFTSSSRSFRNPFSSSFSMEPLLS